MSRLIRSAPAFSPPVVPEASKTETISPDASLKLSSAALMLVAIPHLILLLFYWLPELEGLPGHDLIVSQLAPLVSAGLVTGGIAQTAGQSSWTSTLAGILMIGTLLLWVACRSRIWALRAPIIPLGVLLTLVAVVQLVLWLIADGWDTAVTGILMLAALAGCLIAAVRRSIGVDVDQLPRRELSLAPLVAFAVLVPLPIAVGRMLFGDSVRTATVLMPAHLRWAAFNSFSTMLLYLAGVAVGLLVWGLWGLLPPWSVRSVGRSVAALVIAIGPGLVLAGGQAANAADERAAELKVGSPADSLPNLCIAWRPQPSSQHTLAISGEHCRRVSAFADYRLVTQRTSEVSFGTFSDLMTPEGDDITSGTVSALYDETVVVLATSREDGLPNLVVGLNFKTAVESWRYTCDSGELKVRMAKVPAGDKPGAGRKTRKGEPASVVAQCAGSKHVLNPDTGTEE